MRVRWKEEAERAKKGGGALHSGGRALVTGGSERGQEE
jgi:hypothetical protein